MRRGVACFCFGTVGMPTDRARSRLGYLDVLRSLPRDRFRLTGSFFEFGALGVDAREAHLFPVEGELADLQNVRGTNLRDALDPKARKR